MAPAIIVPAGISGGPYQIVGATAGGGATTTTWNPSDKNAAIALSGGNLIGTGSSGGGFVSGRAIASMTGSDKRHFEVVMTAQGFGIVGVGNSSATLNDYVGNDANGVGYVFNGQVQVAGPGVVGISSYTAGDIISVEIDRGAKLIWFAKNTGDWNNDPTANPATGTGGIDITAVAGNLFPMVSFFSNGDVRTGNFGGSAYTKSASSGFGNF